MGSTFTRTFWCWREGPRLRSDEECGGRRLVAIGLANHFDLFLHLEELAHAFPAEWMVVGNDDSDGHGKYIGGWTGRLNSRPDAGGAAPWRGPPLEGRLQWIPYHLPGAAAQAA